MLAFAIAALTIVVVMAALAIAIARAQADFVRRLKGSTLHVRRGSALALIAAGMWLIALAIWAEKFAPLFNL